MTEKQIPNGPTTGISKETLNLFDRACREVEEMVVASSLANDDPHGTMGAEAETMIRNGLGFVSKMLRAAMQFEAEGILEDEIDWAKSRLPVYGVSSQMVMNNLRRYAESLEEKLPEKSFNEIKPYLDGMMHKQQGIVELAGSQG